MTTRLSPRGSNSNRSSSRISSSVRNRRRNDASRSALADLEDLLAPGFAGRAVGLELGLGRLVEAALDVLPDLEADVVGIDAARMRADHLIVPDQELQVDLLGQIEAVHDLVVPVAGPALVHDLGLDLGKKVLSLVVNDGQDILLPRLEMAVVVADEQQDVLFGLERHLAQIGLDVVRPAMQAGERVVGRLGRLDQALALLLRASSLRIAWLRRLFIDRAWAASISASTRSRPIEGSSCSRAPGPRAS